MTSVQFCYWFQGAFELGTFKNGATVEQMEMIQKHLALVFKHEIDSFYPNQGELNDIHSGKPSNPFSPHDTIVRC